VLPDPRVVAEGMTMDDFREQYELSIRVMELANLSRETVKRINDVWDPIEKKKEEGEKLNRKEARLYEALTPVRDELITAKSRYPQPMVNDQISYLYGMLGRADQKPGKDAYTRYDDLENQLNSIIERLESILK
jgi:hypothetical protein